MAALLHSTVATHEPMGLIDEFEEFEYFKDYIYEINIDKLTAFDEV